jgi:hypothetical protein
LITSCSDQAFLLVAQLLAGGASTATGENTWRTPPPYRLTPNPTVLPVFPLGSDVYFGDRQPPPPAPVFDPWTDPSVVVGAGQITSPHLQAPATAASGPGEFRSYSSGIEASTHHGSGGGAPHPPKPGPGPLLLARIQSQQIPQHLETGSGFAVEGAEIRSVWTLPTLFADSVQRLDWWRIGPPGLQYLTKPAPVLVKLNSGLFLALTALPDFIAALVTEDRGLQAVSYRDPHDAQNTGDLAAQAIARLESGALRADAIDDLAVDLRQHKHADPVLGVISAYLYDSIGATEDIRRMAYFYVSRGQSIPYYIALLAQLGGRRNASGLLEIDVPGVPPRAPRTERETQFDWTCQATYTVTGTVAGLWPWMRQGWAFLDDPTDQELGLVDPNIVALAAQLTTARFTTFNRQGGAALAQYLGLVPFPIH